MIGVATPLNLYNIYKTGAYSKCYIIFIFSNKISQDEDKNVENDMEVIRKQI